jgi:hypothetical protein
MSANHDFSRRFFADFIASRIKAWSLGEGGSKPARRAAAVAADSDPNPLRTGAGDPTSIDEPRGLLPTLGSSGV